MNINYSRYRRRIGRREVDFIDYQLLKNGFTNEVIAGYRRLMRSKHNDPD
jgi:hypothetical protein